MSMQQQSLSGNGFQNGFGGHGRHPQQMLPDGYPQQTIETRQFRVVGEKEEAIEELKRCSDTQFDRNVVNALLLIINEEE